MYPSCMLYVIYECSQEKEALGKEVESLLASKDALAERLREKQVMSIYVIYCIHIVFS